VTKVGERVETWGPGLFQKAKTDTPSPNPHTDDGQRNFPKADKSGRNADCIPKADVDAKDKIIL
jgi:hypothetical protein